MMRLAHLTDIHLGPLPKIAWRSLMSKRITGYVNWHRRRNRSHQAEILSDLLIHLGRQKPDHVAVTGDLVNLGLPAEFDAAQAWLKMVGTGQDVTVVCGNHDAYVPGSLHKALRSWQEYVRGDDERQVSGRRAYPVVRRRGKVSIIGCNSARASMPFLAVGRFGSGQASRLESVLAEEQARGQFRIVLIHHPPFRGATPSHKRLIGASRFRGVIARQGAELVLHGHTHVDSFMEIPGMTGPVPVIGAPAAGQAPGDKRPSGRYNMFTIAGDGSRWRVGWEEFGFSGGGRTIVKLSERTLR